MTLWPQCLILVYPAKGTAVTGAVSGGTDQETSALTGRRNGALFKSKIWFNIFH